MISDELIEILKNKDLTLLINDNMFGTYRIQGLIKLFKRFDKRENPIPRKYTIIIG